MLTYGSCAPDGTSASRSTFEMGGMRYSSSLILSQLDLVKPKKSVLETNQDQCEAWDLVFQIFYHINKYPVAAVMTQQAENLPWNIVPYIRQFIPYDFFFFYNMCRWAQTLGQTTLRIKWLKSHWYFRTKLQNDILKKVNFWPHTSSYFNIFMKTACNCTIKQDAYTCRVRAWHNSAHIAVEKWQKQVILFGVPYKRIVLKIEFSWNLSLTINFVHLQVDFNPDARPSTPSHKAHVSSQSD